MSAEGNRIAVVIVNYRQERYLPALFESLADQSLPASHVVLVNSVPSGFVPPGGTHVIDMTHNEGYAAALNRGIDWVLAQDVDGVMLLNADTKLHPDCLKILSETDGDIVQPLILLMGRPDNINVAGLKPTFLGIAYCMGYKKPRTWAGSEVKQIPAASGAAMLVRPRVFERIGSMNEEYFMYLEDLDFSLRARNSGFRVVMNPKAVAWHEYRLKLGPAKMLRMLRGSGKIRKLLRP